MSLTDTEHALRRQVTLSKWCTLRTGCEVTGQYRAEPPVVEYLDEHGTPRRIQGSWLIGADGKVGIVRKHFLEPTTGIRQQRGSYDYTGTWVAANLKITPPTPQTHPKFPLWQLGYTPDQVYNLFWPEGWHFCCPPGKATATGRFGAYHERLWRHEFCQDDWHDEMDAVQLFWEHIMPMITRGQDTDGYKLPEHVQFPRDCVEILRCRPFRFVHKVVNRWFDGRVVLIGDAAHVFPPFAGQGIGSGVRDAQQLAWRLALMLSQPQMSNLTKSNILDAWTLERRHSVDAAAYMSMLNGTMINREPARWIWLLIQFVKYTMHIPFVRKLLNPEARIERVGFIKVQGGFFLKDYNGGARLAQIFMQSDTREPILSDELWRPSESIFKLLVVGSTHHAQNYQDAETAIRRTILNSAVLGKSSIVLFDPESTQEINKASAGKRNGQIEIFRAVATPQSSGRDHPPEYNHQSFSDRLGSTSRFVVVRPDFFTFGCARNLEELITVLSELKTCLSNEVAPVCNDCS
ncbi:hypothetical protein TruAng_008131 [Truncatella angustata]|nr:hypothetical protein TruAng_008131 [Truncatella angustata]